jgi:hypothetical protein
MLKYEIKKIYIFKKEKETKINPCQPSKLVTPVMNPGLTP